ncbi:MAG: sigma-70 family RNA polymerase sigma factor [Myxococcales bacterium]|nr:sigma-70 family RNA polymerase sigma factor [Myxococcales bacterium]
MKDDLELFDAWSSGDVEAGQQLVRRYYDGIYVFFASRLPEDVAADLTQQTFEAMCAKAERLSIHTSFASYLLGIARFKLVGWLGHKARRNFDPVTDTIPSDLGDSPTLTSILTDKRRESRLVLALRRLPLDDQLLLELRTYEGLGMREIAEVLGVPYNRIATRLATAKRRLRRATQEVPPGEDTITTLTVYMKDLHDRLLESHEPEEDTLELPPSEP